MPDPSPVAARPRRRWLPAALFIALVVVPLVTVAALGSALFRPDGTVLEVEMRATGGTAAQLFWTSTWAFSPEASSVVPLHQHPGEYERLRFPLPSERLLFLRFDPLNGPGEVLIRRIRVLDRDGGVVRTIDPMVLSPLHQIEGLMPVGQDVRAVTTKDANDPMLLMRSAWLTAPPKWYSLQFVTPFSLAWIAAASVALVVAALGFLARDLRAGPFTIADGCWLGALFPVTLWAKLLLVEYYPMTVPFWDQWDGEVASLYLPFAQDALTWHQMFTPHNEHRIFFTRVLALVLVGTNGQWDPQLQIVVNAAIHALVAVVFAAMLWSERRWLPIFVLTIGLAFAPPFALENTLAGFQSAFYFFVLFAGLAIWLMGTHGPGTRAWFIGWLCAFAALVTIGGGILTIAAIGTLIALSLFNAPRESRQTVANLAALAVVAGLGYALLVPPLPNHDYLKAGTWLAFKISFARNLAFPWITWPRLSPVLWVPLILVAVIVLIKRLKTTKLERMSLALGAWVVIQAATVAYTRGVNGTAPASRYLDMLSFGLVVNTVALVALLAHFDGWARRWMKKAAQGALTLWLVGAIAGVTLLSQAILAKDGREKLLWMNEYVRNVRHFVVTGDLPTLVQKRGPFEIPYFSPMMLAGWLTHPYVRHILPATVREPLTLATGETTGAFGQASSHKDLLSVWDSYVGGRSKAQGRFESQPIACREYQQIRFEVAGALRASGQSLVLKPSDGGRETIVRPPLIGGSGWTAVSVRCPSTAFTVLAVDSSPTAWFAFHQPSEIGWASSVAESLIQQSWAFGLASFLSALGAVFGAWRRRSSA
jgi:hypothetical protein